jgi:hypothetical protein
MADRGGSVNSAQEVLGGGAGCQKRKDFELQLVLRMITVRLRRIKTRRNG